VDPDAEPNQTGDESDVTENPYPWMPTWLINWLRGIRPWPWMPTVVIALVLVILYLLRRRGRRSS
jgi:type II secretory pathway component PulF